jgi:hypothetical protein
MDVKRFSRAADSYWRLRGALQDYESPVNKIKRPVGMQTRDFNRRVISLAKCEATIMREIMSIRTGLK